MNASQGQYNRTVSSLDEEVVRQGQRATQAEITNVEIGKAVAKTVAKNAVDEMDVVQTANAQRVFDNALIDAKDSKDLKKTGNDAINKASKNIRNPFAKLRFEKNARDALENRIVGLTQQENKMRAELQMLNYIQGEDTRFSAIARSGEDFNHKAYGAMQRGVETRVNQMNLANDLEKEKAIRLVQSRNAENYVNALILNGKPLQAQQVLEKSPEYVSNSKYNELQNKIQVSLKKEATDKAESYTQTVRQVNDYIKNGIPFSMSEPAEAMLAKTNPKLLQQYHYALDNNLTTKTFAEIDELNAQATDPTIQMMLGQYSQNLRTSLTNDPYNTALKQGTVSGNPSIPLPVVDKDGNLLPISMGLFLQSLPGRMDMNRKTSEYYDFPVPYFSAQEKKQLTEMMQRVQPSERLLFYRESMNSAGGNLGIFDGIANNEEKVSLLLSHQNDANYGKYLTASQNKEFKLTRDEISDINNKFASELGNSAYSQWVNSSPNSIDGIRRLINGQAKLENMDMSDAIKSQWNFVTLRDYWVINPKYFFHNNEFILPKDMNKEMLINFLQTTPPSTIPGAEDIYNLVNKNPDEYGFEMLDPFSYRIKHLGKTGSTYLGDKGGDYLLTTNDGKFAWSRY